MKRRIFAIMLLAAALTAFGTATAAVRAPQLPRTLSNARFVYVAAYDGDQFDPNLLPDDRAAISRVEDAIQKWGKLTIVYRAQDADIILMVESRPSEDVLAVYDARSASQTYLWRVMGRGGLQKSEIPLLSQFERAWDKITK
jgi:hypothetical protein